MKKALVGLVVVMLALTAVPAAAAHYRWHGDPAGDATFDDIVGARINTYRRDDGTKMLRVYVDLEPHETPNPYDDPDDCLDTVVVFFDTRGDEHPDFRLSQSSDCASGGGGGYLIRIGHGPLDVRFVRPWGCGGDGFCPIFPVRFEFHHLRATKHVRWFVRSGSLAATLATDRAPDHGWYEH